MKTLVRSLVPVLSVVALFACNRDRVNNDTDTRSTRDYGDKSGTTTLTGGTPAVGNDSAIERIAMERCARETACNNIGADKRFASDKVCVSKVRTDLRDSLNAGDCPRGVDTKELNECIEAIRTENCNNPFEAVSRMAACRTSDLCLKTDVPNR